MVRLFLTPSFSPVNTLMQCTPWVSVKVTPQRNVIPVSLSQRIFLLGLCLLFWKTLLPLSIGLAVWYQLREARNEQIQNEIELIEKHPELWESTELLQETREHLATRCDEFGLNPFDKGDVEAAAAFRELSLSDLKKYIRASKLSGDLPYLTEAVRTCGDDERFCTFANKYPLWALKIDINRVKRLIPKDLSLTKRDKITALVFKKLPLPQLKEALAEIPISEDLFIQGEGDTEPSYLVQAITQCQDLDRLGLFAERYPVWALELNPELTAKLDLDFFKGDALAATAFVRLPMDALGKAITASTMPDELFEDPHSLFARAVATCVEPGALQALAGKYPKQTLRLLPTNRWGLLGDGERIEAAKCMVNCELGTLRIQELSGPLTGGSVTLRASDVKFIESLYESCNPQQQKNLLDSIQESPEHLNELPTNYEDQPLDFSFVEDAWFETIFPKLNSCLKRSILFSGGDINQNRILAHAPLDSWKEFVQVHVSTPRPDGLPETISGDESPRTRGIYTRYLLQSLCERTSLENEILIMNISLEQFKEIFTGYEGDLFALMKVISYQNEKVRWLIETYNPDPEETANCLVSRSVTPERIIEISEGLTCRDELLQAFHAKSPIPDLADLLSLPSHEATAEKESTPFCKTAAEMDKPSAVEGASGVESHLKALGASERRDFYTKLVTPATSTEAVEELESKAALTLRSGVTAFAEGVVNIGTEFAFHAVLGGDHTRGLSGLGAYVSNLLPNGHGATPARGMLYLLLDNCKPEEMPNLCEIAPRPVLTYLALKRGFGDFSALITQESVAALGDAQRSVAKLFCEKKRHAELLTMAKHVEISTLLPDLSDRGEFYKALAPAQLGQMAQLDKPSSEPPAKQMDLSDIKLIINKLEKDARLELFKACPIYTLRAGGVSLAEEVRRADEWSRLNTKELLSVLPLRAVIGDPITQEKLQAALRNCGDTLPPSILDALETKEHVDWAIAVLSEKAGAALITEKIQPTSLECLKAKLESFRARTEQPPAEEPPVRGLRQALLGEYAHKIPVDKISPKFLCYKPARALLALENSNLSPEQRTAFICAGAESEDVINSLNQNREDVLTYVSSINNLNPIHVWRAVENFGDDIALLSKLGTFEQPKTFPIPKGPKQWHCALQVGAFKKALVHLISQWKGSQPGKYESERQCIEKSDLQLLREALEGSGNFYGRQYAKTDFAKEAEVVAEAPQSEPVTPTQARRVHNVASLTFSPRTPLAEVQPPEGFASPDTLVTATSTVRRLRGSPLQPNAPLSQFIKGETVHEIRNLDLTTPAERLAKRVLASELTFAQALQQQADFVTKLPGEPASVSEDGFDDATPFYLGELCLKVSLEEATQIASMCNTAKQKSIHLFLATSKHALDPNDQRLACFPGTGTRSTVQHSPPRQSVSRTPSGTSHIYG